MGVSPWLCPLKPKESHYDMIGSTHAVKECPTRGDGIELLISQKVTTSICQGRQRSHYHKCYTCVHYNDSESKPHPAVSPLPSLEAARRQASQAQASAAVRSAAV